MLGSIARAGYASRWEKKVGNYLAFLHLACAQLIFAKVIVFGYVLSLGAQLSIEHAEISRHQMGIMLRCSICARREENQGLLWRW